MMADHKPGFALNHLKVVFHVLLSKTSKEHFSNRHAQDYCTQSKTQIWDSLG